MTDVSETEQMVPVVLAKLTVSPEEAVAASVSGPAPKVWLAGAAKVMVWLACEMAKLCVTAVAAAKLSLPVWLAVTEQVPGATIVRLDPATVQTVLGVAV